MRSPFLCCATVAVCLVQLASAWKANTLPNPQTEFTQCGRSVKGFVCSPDGLVDVHTLDVIQGQINAIYHGTAPYAKLFCPKVGKDVAVEIMAAVVGKVEGTGDARKAVKRFATGVHNRFGVGSKECGSGVVIAVSVEDRQVYISTGKTVEQTLTTSRIEALVNGVKPELRAGKYGKAVEKLVVEVGLVLASECAKTGTCKGDSWPRWHQHALVWGVVGFIFAAVGFKNRYDARQRQEVSSKLRKLQKDLKASKEGKYVSTSCPICLGDFAPSHDSPTSPPTTTTTTTDVVPPSELASTHPTAHHPAPSASQLPSTSDVAPDSDPLLSQRECPPSSSTPATSSGKGAQAGYLPAMQGDGGTKAGAKHDAHPPKVPFMLPCGHSFCETCILEWIKKKAECPVCRKPATGEDSTSTGAAQGRQSSNLDPGASTSQPGGRPPMLRLRPRHRGFRSNSYGLGYDEFGPELAFRLHRMRNRHRNHLSQEAVDDLMWQANGGVGPRPGSHRGPVEDWGSHPEFLRQMDEATRASRASSGAHGSGGASFSGGSSSGGGGGSW